MSSHLCCTEHAACDGTILGIPTFAAEPSSGWKRPQRPSTSKFGVSQGLDLRLSGHLSKNSQRLFQVALTNGNNDEGHTERRGKLITKAATSGTNTNTTDPCKARNQK